MIRELLEKRISDYDDVTKQILGLYEVKLIKALRFYMKTERSIRISTIEFHSLNHNFIIANLVTDLIVGDEIKLPSGTVIVINETNINNYVGEPLKIVLPITNLENDDAMGLYDLLKQFDAFVKQYGVESFRQCLEAGITDLNDICNNSKYDHLLDSLTDPIKDILNNLDDLQKIQYELFSKTVDKVIN